MPHRTLRRFHQQSAQKRIALFADVPEPLLATAAGMLAGNQSQVAGHLFATAKTLRRSHRQRERQRRDRSHAWMRHRCAAGRAEACSATARSSSAITHEKVLVDCDAEFQEFIETMDVLGKARTDSGDKVPEAHWQMLSKTVAGEESL